MRRKIDSRHAPPRRHTPVRPTAERLPDLREAALPPAPSLQVAIALVTYSITHTSSSPGKSS